MRKIVIDRKPFILNTADFPIVIHGREKSGASLSSVILASVFCRAGKPILFWSAYPMAKEELKKELSGSPAIHSIANADDISGDEPQIMIIEDGNPQELKEALGKVNPGRIVVAKNFETLPEVVRNTLIKRENCIISGDLEKVLTVEQISKFSTKIFFSPFLKMELPLLLQYQGFISYSGGTGIARIIDEQRGGFIKI